MRDLRSDARTIVERASVLPRGALFAVGVGVAFGLGVVVAGGFCSARAVAGEPQDVLAHAAEKTRVYEEKRAALKLTYAHELLRPDPVHIVKLPRRAAKVVEPVASPLEAAPAPAPDAAPAPAPAAPTKQAVKPVAAEDAAPVERVDRERLQQAVAKVLGAPAATSSKSFSLQVASVPTRAGAEGVAKKMPGARVVEGEVGGKAVFRVRLGGYPDRAAAEAAKAKLSAPSFIVSE